MEGFGMPQLWNTKDFKPSNLIIPSGVWKDDVATGSIASDKLARRGGDADVFSKGGRRTRVTLRARDIRMSQDGNAFLVDVFYEVFERSGDNTRLTWEGTARCNIPHDALAGSSIDVDVREYDRAWDVLGQEHDSLPVPSTDGTCISHGVYRIDGKGPDTTNAAVELSFRVPFRYFDKTP